MKKLFKTCLFVGIFAYFGINDVFAMQQGAKKNNLDKFVKTISPHGLVVSPRGDRTQKQLRNALVAYVKALLLDADEEGEAEVESDGFDANEKR